jgi:hypothetical protein
LKSLAACAVAVLSVLLIFPAMLPQMTSADVTPIGAPPSGGARAEPDICGTGPHARWTSYDFSNTYMFYRWAVVMETGNATLMKDIGFSNDQWTSCASLPAGLNRSWHVAVYDDHDNIVIVRPYIPSPSAHTTPLPMHGPTGDRRSCRSFPPEYGIPHNDA